jgi:hypothetical protein
MSEPKRMYTRAEWDAMKAKTLADPGLALVELIQWHDANEVQPDEGITVLLFVPAASEPVFPGYLDVVTDETVWRWADGSRVDENNAGDLNKVVTHWAEMPGGPNVE